MKIHGDEVAQDSDSGKAHGTVIARGGVAVAEVEEFGHNPAVPGDEVVVREPCDVGGVGYTFRPGTYKGLIVAIVLHMAHVNLMFAKGMQLLDCDVAGLLNGTAARARHIRFSDPAPIVAVVGAERRAFAWSIKRCPIDGADPRRRG